jgi:hypothetical protein
MIRITIKHNEETITKEVNVSKTLSGDFILKEHPDLDIIIQPSKQKIIAIPKKEYGEYVNKVQYNFFEYMKSNGVVIPESIRGNNIFGAMEGKYPEKSTKDSQDTFQVSLYVASNFIDEEKPKEVYAREYEKAFHDQLMHPNEKDSTELGEVPQEPVKGSIPRSGFPLKAIYRYTY